jgi:RimJ/RimL family protein N-acetyltransferase
MDLFPIGRDGELPEGVTPDDYLTMIVEMTVSHYERTGFPTPWIGYIAMGDSEPIGVCGFKSAPVDGRIEIAYGTLSGHEGKGVATAMAKVLVQMANQEESGLTVFAQTLPEQNASTSILKKLGFTLTGPVEHPEDGTVWEWELR